MIPDCTEELLIPLRESIIDKPPFVGGVLQLAPSQISLFYKIAGEGDASRHVNLSNATFNELEQLAQACDPATFGLNSQDVMDETYRKAGKMDSCNFSTQLLPDQTDLVNVVRGYLLEGIDSTRKLKVEQYKLNVYGKGSFFKSHVDTPRSEKMFGSLVVVFPSPHEGGTLLIRHQDQEWSFDSGAALKSAPPLSVGYVAFFSDVEHEVEPVVAGHRVTLTYNLHFDDDGLAPAWDLISGPASPPRPANERIFRAAFEEVLENPEFLPDGGLLGFGLRHVYQVQHGLEHVYNLLKGSDAAVYRSICALGFKPALYLYYQNFGVGLIQSVPTFDLYNPIEYGDKQEEAFCSQGGIIVGTEAGFNSEFCDDVHWVTPVTTFNRQESPYVGYGNEASLELAYGDVCLIVDIGKMGERQEGGYFEYEYV